MEVLNRPGQPAQAGRIRVLLLAVLVTVTAGCALVGVFSSGPAPYAFSHRLHVGEKKLECIDCHRGAADEDDPGMPTLAQCRLCHKDLDADKPPERQVEVLFLDRDYRAARASKLADEVKFSHKQHNAAPGACNTCHAGIETNEVIDRSFAIRMDDCTKCHSERGVANDCASCHREIGVDRPPANHSRQWQQLHGQVVRAHTEGTANQCALCHQESSCTKCHLDTPPQNHDNYFRLRGHGLYARLDRTNCSACHRSDSCDSCHRETRPITHVGQWGGTRSNHCLGCHFPLQGNDCATCHKSTPSHAQATPMPPDHNPAMNCRQCHGAGQPLPHVDKGDECIQCHR